ncbi:GH92 family glycosyl hydrolase [Sphingomonas sp. 2R-10]|uniref:GH92 family glycosyl hydrolase n=1 Tax=Sphingomonas sp. 2R-10 TaxID=3045148 RepID=UPI000F7735EF|nr:GH92 family glycosyl hydrolase [Sphingomonas sp. 2R-10]MDJ0275664.1 GH92 family glycosyl hydrolase [Sphingomonas sp. 2R-10]
MAPPRLTAAATALALILGTLAPATAQERRADPADLVNPLMGTDSTYELSYGNTYPAIALPWGMNFWTPTTNKAGDGWAYRYRDSKLWGFKQTHQPSPWMNDYGAFSLMAMTGAPKLAEADRASWYSHKAETARPYYYSAYLADYDTTVEIAPTERAAQFRFTFPESDQSWILLDAFDKGSAVTILPKQRRIIGWAKNNSGGVPANFRNYFVLEFDRDFAVADTFGDGFRRQSGVTTAEGKRVGALIGFRTRKGEQVNVRVASSFISAEQAQLNLDRELGRDGFDATKEKARATWNALLGRYKVDDPDIDNVRTFYSALYRTQLFPRRFHEYDRAGKMVHYSPYNGQVLPGPMFTDNGFWDTFRAVFPLFTIMERKLDGEIMEGLANTYRESGWLPEWASPGHRDVMIGSNSAVNIADAYLKGIRGYDIETLYEAIKKNATTSVGRPRSADGKTISAVGREGVEYYNRLGYVPYDVGIKESAARTLEYAYADFTIARLAEALGKKDDAAMFRARAQNYRKLFDPTVGWMRGRNRDGTFQTPFNPLKWGDAFTEGNSMHYSWSVFQDVRGLIDLMGGDRAFVAKIDQVFDSPPKFDDSYYGFTIHEIREMQIVNMGNYAHGNQPIQHMIYLYDYAGAPWKTQWHVRNVMRRLYAAQPDGYPGDEDNGQTSAWYVFSALGFYPVTPGANQYVIGSPLFRRSELALENGKRFVVEAPGNSAANVYIQSATLNGRKLDRTWISQDEIMAGGTLRFVMGPTPNRTWATGPGAAPYSMTPAGSAR